MHDVTAKRPGVKMNPNPLRAWGGADRSGASQARVPETISGTDQTYCGLSDPCNHLRRVVCVSGRNQRPSPIQRWGVKCPPTNCGKTLEPRVRNKEVGVTPIAERIMKGMRTPATGGSRR